MAIKLWNAVFSPLMLFNTLFRDPLEVALITFECNWWWNGIFSHVAVLKSLFRKSLRWITHVYNYFSMFQCWQSFTSFCFCLLLSAVLTAQLWRWFFLDIGRRSWIRIRKVDAVRMTKFCWQLKLKISIFTRKLKLSRLFLPPVPGQLPDPSKRHL